MPVAAQNTKLSFGLYEVDLKSGELWKAGFRIKLQNQPFKVLAALLERPGQVITREELQERLWGTDTVVDFDHSLGTAINKIREALGDLADNPRFIETLARRGYRFIAPVAYRYEPEPEPIALQAAAAPAAAPTDSPAAIAAPVLAAPVATFLPTAATREVRIGVPALVGTALLAAIAIAASLWRTRAIVAPPHITKITQNGHLATSLSSMENLAAGVTDGVHLFAPVIENGRTTLAAISLTGGAVTPINIPSEVASPALGDISPDGSRLLLREHLSPESEQPLWVVPTLGGSSQRVGNALAHDATWMPDGNSIIFANGNDLYAAQLNGSNPQLYARLPGRAFWLRWSPNGKFLRFTIIDPIAHTLALWQLTPADRQAKPILDNFNTPANECCGVWTADSSTYIFQSNHAGTTDLWKLHGDSDTHPVRITDGPLQFQSPLITRNNRLYFLGVDARSELQQVTPAGGLAPERGFLSSAIRVDYTRDGKWVAWTNDNGQLWRSRIDGSDQIQLSSETLSVFLAHWSPDGTQLAMMAREPGKAWNIYLVGVNGTDLRPLMPGVRNAADPSWSPDGKTLAFGRVNDVMGKESAERVVEMFDLASATVTPLAGSENLFSPRWSPDGRYIVALSLDQRRVRLLDVATKVWTTLPVPSGADPVWSSDSKFLYIHASLEPGQPIDRISIPDGHVQELIRLADAVDTDAVDYVFGGLTTDNRPLIRTRVFTGNVYSMDLK